MTTQTAPYAADVSTQTEPRAVRGSTARVWVGAGAVLLALVLWLAYLAVTAEPRVCDRLYEQVQAGELRHQGNQLPDSCY